MQTVRTQVFQRRRAFVFVVVFCITAAACQTPIEEPESGTNPLAVRIATGGVMDPLAQALTESLRDHFPVHIQQVSTNALISNAHLIEQGQVELAIIPTNVAYAAYTEGGNDLRRPHRKLRGVAVLYTIPLHLIATEGSGVQSILDIRGKRIAIGNPGSTTQLIVRLTLEGLGLSFDDIEVRPIAGDTAVEELRSHNVEAAFNRGNDPNPRVENLLQVPGARLVPILRTEIEAIRSIHPFLRPTWIPAGMYGNHPEIGTIGVDTLMVCREDLPEDLVYWITRALFESMTALVRSTNSLHQVDLERFHAAPIPLHAGAARYYRERDLFQ